MTMVEYLQSQRSMTEAEVGVVTALHDSRDLTTQECEAIASAHNVPNPRSES